MFLTLLQVEKEDGQTSKMMEQVSADQMNQAGRSAEADHGETQ